MNSSGFRGQHKNAFAQRAALRLLKDVVRAPKELGRVAFTTPA
jgi:para-aminobenzoate synthetase component I